MTGKHEERTEESCVCLVTFQSRKKHGLAIMRHIFDYLCFLLCTCGQGQGSGDAEAKRSQLAPSHRYWVSGRPQPDRV